MGGYRPDPLKLGIRERRYRRVTVPPNYLWGVTDTPRLWFIKLRKERGGAPEARAPKAVPDTCSICLALYSRRASKRGRGAWVWWIRAKASSNVPSG